MWPNGGDKVRDRYGHFGARLLIRIFSMPGHVRAGRTWVIRIMWSCDACYLQCLQCGGHITMVRVGWSQVGVALVLIIRPPHTIINSSCHHRVHIVDFH